MTPSASTFLQHHRTTQNAEWELLLSKQAELGDLLKQHHATDPSAFNPSQTPNDLLRFRNEIRAEVAEYLEERGREFDKEVGAEGTEDRREILRILGQERKGMSMLRDIIWRAERQLERCGARDGDGVGGGEEGDSAGGAAAGKKG